MSQTNPRSRQDKPAPAPPIGRGPGRGPGHGHMAAVERAEDVRGTVLRLWTYLRRQKWALITVVFTTVATTATQLAGPYLLGVAIDNYILPGDLPGLLRIALLMLVIYWLHALLTWFVMYVMAGAAQRMLRDLRNDLFTKLQTLSLRYFDAHAHGDLMSRLTNDMETINMVLTDSVTRLISGVMMLAGVAAVMLWLNPYLAAVSMITIPLMMLTFTRWVGKRTRKGFREQQSSLGELNGLIEETVTGQRVIKAYVREEAALNEFNTTNRQLRHAAIRAQIYAGLMGPAMNFINNSGLAIVAGAGGWMAVNGLATVGAIASFINYTRQFGRPLNEMANLYNQIQAAVAGAERIFETIDEEPEVFDAPDAASLDDMRGDVVMEGVTFSYTQGVPVLKRVSLHAKPGEIVALVGPTGAGKTTIVNVLTRFYDIDSGRILVDGHDIRHVKKDDLRRQLGIVLQDTFLFSGSVMDNIRYGRLDAGDDEVIAAAKMANADQFIHRLPHGYDTHLSERAGNLSQGQRQLLAIARAILANPSILILDEATSSVDTRTEKHIQEAMLRLMQGRTSFVIAHRLSTIRDADQILVVNNGEIIERGKHAELLAQQGFYYDLYTSQFRANGRADEGEVAGLRRPAQTESAR